ncbi:MAG: hypothetical protein KGY40_02120 [Thioalkalivibrio sp.]|nr:hypothetical protein [Thioalkalivibrio sp.]
MRLQPASQPGDRRWLATRTAVMRAMVLAVLLAGVASVHAQIDHDNPEATIWNLDEAVAQVEAHYPGRVLSAREALSEHGSHLFLIRILTDDQQVRTLTIEEGTELEPVE